MKLKPSEIKLNPDNPRIIKDEKYQRLVQSLKDFPEMANVREVVLNKDNVILGGNMRFKAMVEAGWTEIPVKIVDWDEAKQKEFIIKDNSNFGEWDWDAVANQYEIEDLEAWGVDIPVLEKPTDEDWADAFDDNAPEKLKGLRQFTLILHEQDLLKVRERLKSDKSFGEQLLIELGIEYDSKAYNQKTS